MLSCRSLSISGLNLRKNRRFALDWFSRKTGDKKRTGEKQEAGKMKSKKQETPVKNRRLDGYDIPI